MATRKPKTPTKISELIPDDKNFNKGSEFGGSLISKSLQKFGAGRSILLDKNNRIIAGNKTVENAGAVGIENVQVVETDGKTIIAVKRTDIDLDTPEGRELALADNATAKANIVFDAEVTIAEVGELVSEEWGVGIGGVGRESQNLELKPFQRTHILLSFPPEKLIEIQEYIEKITQFDFVEYEQGSN